MDSPFRMHSTSATKVSTPRHAWSTSSSQACCASPALNAS
eukprot:CAMPEP_0204430152 /NCGR_PEP_ID=MMETSP0470-20130426/61823_1 /ASSEMBLY_ACC=CAM_ASM_000385 /TAXON_ID=2969 /ORGANISM="Oxyrrhis marina" /LENGTH=39 /DNA_ID= /DNA_START= /DNA_END= /DNA_ORIENTATION=